MSLSKKIDFAIIIRVTNANPNGDPLNGNRPRTNNDGLGEISDVAIKRKIRNRLLDAGEAILVQSDDYREDEYRSIKDRFDANERIGKIKKNKNTENQAKASCQEWFDVRAFGMVLAFEGEKEGSDGVSIPVRGPVSIQSAFSVETVDIESTQITKSVNLKTNKTDPSKKTSDTIGMKHRVDSGVYVTYGSINRQLAEKTGFSDEDALKLRDTMTKMFENDESSARPAGSMEVLKVIWWTHKDKTVSSAKVHRSLAVNPDGTYELDEKDDPNTGIGRPTPVAEKPYKLSKIDGVVFEEIDGQ